MAKLILWRAANDDIVPCDGASFARHRSDAEAYLDNRGFGGQHLFRSVVDVDSSRVLHLYDERRPLDKLVRKLGLPHPGAINVEEWIPQSIQAQEALQELGIDWVVVRDSFPEGAETWIWVGPSENEPELELVS